MERIATIVLLVATVAALGYLKMEQLALYALNAEIAAAEVVLVVAAVVGGVETVGVAVLAAGAAIAAIDTPVGAAAAVFATRRRMTPRDGADATLYYYLMVTMVHEQHQQRT